MWQQQFWQHPLGRLQLTQGPTHGRRFVFLHGVLRSWQTFLPLLAPLSTRYELTGIDLRGHGASDKPTEGYLVVDHVKHLRNWLTQVNGEPVVLYGHSLGAMVALKLAAEEPERVAGLVLEDPPFHTMGSRIHQTPWRSYFRAIQAFAGTSQPVAEIARTLAEILWSDPNAEQTIRLGDVRDGVSLRFLASTLRQVHPAVLDPVIAGEWLSGYDLEEAAAAVRCPVLLLQADPTAGGTLSDADVALIRSLLRNVSVVRFAQAGHNLHTARTQEIVNLLFAFVESLSP